MASLMGMHVVVIFHNKERTDYQVRGPFKTGEDAVRFAETVWDNYTPSAIHAVETVLVLEGK